MPEPKSALEELLAAAAALCVGTPHAPGPPRPCPSCTAKRDLAALAQPMARAVLALLEDGDHLMHALSTKRDAPNLAFAEQRFEKTLDRWRKLGEAKEGR